MKGGDEGEKTYKHENNSQDTGVPLLARGQFNRSGLKNFFFSGQKNLNAVKQQLQWDKIKGTLSQNAM